MSSEPQSGGPPAPNVDWLDRCQGLVVVGDDGSPDAAAAVQWSFDDARRRQVSLAVLRGWSLTTAPRPRGAELGYVPSEEEYAAAVAAEMSEDAARVLGTSVAQAAIDNGSLLFLPVHQPIEQVLSAVSERAAVTVVGARGAGLAKLLGSVSSALLRHARGPVAVIPRSRQANREGTAKDSR